jgi:hypothetical protein
MKKVIVLVLALIGLTATQAFATVILVDDFENASDWSAGGGSAKGLNSVITTDSSEAQVGSNAIAMTYDLTTAQGADYVDFYKWNTTFYDLREAESVNFYLKQPNDPDMLLQLRIASSYHNGFLEYNLPEGDGLWQFFSLQISSFADYGSAPDLSKMNIFIFRANGDISASATLNTIFVDQMNITTVQEPSIAAIFCLGGLALIRTRMKKKKIISLKDAIE